MSANNWMKWLSVIALVLAGIDFIGNVYDFIVGEILTLTSVTIFLLAIIAVVTASKKK